MSDRQPGTVSVWPLRVLLFFQLLLIALVPMLLVGVALVLRIEPQVEDAARERARTLTVALAGQIDTHLAGAERELASLAAQLSLNGSRREAAMDSLLDAVVRDGSLYEAIYLAWADGAVTALGLPSGRRQARSDLKVVDLSRREFVGEAMSRGETVWSAAFLSAVSGRLTVAIALPLKGGVLVAEIALPQLSFFLRKLQLGGGDRVMVLDSMGNVIAHPVPGMAGQQISLSGLDLVRHAFAGSSAYGEVTLDGARLLGQAQTLSRVRWVVVAAQPEAEGRSLMRAANEVMLTGLLLASLLALIVAWLVSRRVVEGFIVYARNVSALARGDYSLTWPSTRVREFASLAADLQETANAIRHREADIRASEQRLLATLESTPNVAIQWFDQAGRVVYWNRSSQTLYGIAADQAMGKTLDQLIYTPAEAQLFVEMLQGIARDGQPVGPYESVFKRPDGSSGFVLCTTFGIPGDAAGLRFVCMDIDITRQKQLTSDLEQREKRYRGLIEQSPMAVIEWDLDFTVGEWNEAAEKIFGYSRSSAIGRHARFIVPPEIHPYLDQIWAALRTNTGAGQSENDNLTADGRRITCQWYNRPILDDFGNVVAVVSLVEDITERIRVARALKASEQRFLAFFNASPVPVAVSRFDQQVVFTGCNEAWEKEFGWSELEIVGHTGLDLELWVDEKERRWLIDALSGNQAQVDTTVSLRRRDGSILICEMSGRAIEVDEERMIIFAYHDVTEERRIQQQIREINATLEERVEKRTAALARANDEIRTTLETLQRAQDELVRSEKMAALGSLVAGVAHELNTPIGNGLMAASTFDDHAEGFRQVLEAGTLKRSALDRFVEDATTASGIILRNLKRASELVTSFKQVAVDQTSAQRRQFSLDEVVGEILLTLGPTLRRLPFDVVTELPAGIMLDSYPGPLGQVLTNLLNNAFIHAFDGREHGKVTVFAERKGTDQVRIEVRDDGLGVAPDNLPRIFDPFFTTRMGKGGSGLGLHICHNIVTRVLGGRIGVVSTRSVGTTLWLEIPLRAPASVAEQ